jgi:hypothetical protein
MMENVVGMALTGYRDVKAKWVSIYKSTLRSTLLESQSL